MKVRKNAASAATVALCLFSGTVFAQDATSSSAENTIAGPEEIIVTAQRRDERLQDVPVAVSALSGNYIAENQVRTLQDLGATVPGLVVTNSVNYGSAPLSIRGIGGANGGGNVFADEPVAVYVDDAYVARLRLSTADLIDIGGIEVLRGPQGVLFGRNSTAGAILVRSATPTKNLTAKVQASASTINEYRAQAAVSGSLDKEGRVKARLAGGYSNRGGWGTNSVPGPKLNRGEDWQVRAFLQLEPVDGLIIDLIGDKSYSKSFPGTINISDVSNLRDQTTNPAGSNVVFPYKLRPDLQQILDNDRFALNFPTFTTINGTNLTGRINWDLGPVTLTSVTNFRRWHLVGTQDSDGTAFDPPTPNFVTGTVANIGNNANGNSRDRQITQELRLASNGDGRISWLLGGYYFNERNSVDPVTISNFLAGPGGAGTLVTFVSNQDTESWAVFANASYELTDGLKLSVGGRYSEETKDFFNSQLVQTINTFDPPGPVVFNAGQVLAAPPNLNLNRKDTDFSPRVVLDYKPTESTLLYASFSQGFKSGGFNAFRGSTVTFAPEGTDAYEIGLKTDIARQLRLNLSAFRYDYSNLQVRTPVPTGGVGIESAAKARSQGVEVEASLFPTNGLRFDINAAYLDAKFLSGSLSAVQAQSYVFGTNPPVVAENVAGNALTRAPKWQMGFSGRYTWELGSKTKATIQGSVRHQSKVYFLETQQQAQTYVGQAWEEVDARVAIGDTDDKWELSLFAKNMFNNRHFSQVTAFFGLPNAALNDPRRFGIQASMKY
ncbi:TonB-dependent receptor [Novosphingobium sp. ERN07]|uniref:TonB-dependent receptor n=1 Tax=Novosphingobium sp. ERN07 TaxID=2726187 RepID=UPI001456A565|nr:TonB-dependent receptor [Novosphingobium sp. ERN07]NLR70313.1 TonB-dependent receptor [Novosphingobium sp. ERN07]